MKVKSKTSRTSQICQEFCSGHFQWVNAEPGFEHLLLNTLAKRCDSFRNCHFVRVILGVGK